MTEIVGHRGARGEVPENTLASFQHAQQLGIRQVELDLHLSADGQLIVIHDPDLRRTTGQHGRVDRWHSTDLVQLDASHCGPTHPSPCPIPTLQHLLQACEFEHWQWEVKSASRRRARRLVEEIQRLHQQYQLTGKVAITSSSRTVLRAAQQLAPEIPRGFVAERAWLNPVKVAKRYDCELLVLNWKLCTPARLRQAHAAGMQVSTWTVNQAHDMRHLADMGVDSLITDFPGLAIATLHAR
ncbi:glycerophosphodiester phosphodiesterase [Atopomonas sediminilitoris]|uniref:glycerophosphodiester phosphodiesterase n=1 Tax=Atopomonas sediminilitoris TaxID=2919919 RepID=UPI001F4E4845|nr:glycerophosphodiester phosphodiesterase [Atopomonas sediminilitoris]MCJ8167710.1 glycerophosphodiester phosphodiesterase [Atopomonas sediminilitoris]